MKLFKKTLCVLLSALLIGCTALIAFAADGEITVSLRIEGIAACLFYDDVTVPAGSCALDVLKAADDASDELTLTIVDSVYGEYLSGVNETFAGSVAPSFYDGWQFIVNGEKQIDETTTYEHSMTSYIVAADDDIVVYYNDEFGATGFMRPVIDTSKLNEGKLSFTATVTEYDADWNPTLKDVAVTGYTLIWDGERITPDENGVVTLTQAQMSEGDHSLQIERYAENGLPTVLRYAPDFTVKIEPAAQEPESEPESEPQAEQEQQNFFAKILSAIKSFFQKIVDFFKGLFNK